MIPANPRHRADVDGLRAVAIVAVLLFHFGLGPVSGGFAGVDVFFVISGFVIAGSLLADIQAGRFSVASFYFKRIRRIFPAYVAVLLATTCAVPFVLLPGDLVDYGRSVMAASTFVSNIFFWKTSGYFAAAAETKPLLHTWSLAVEEQFYVFAPLAFWFIARFAGARWLTFFVPAILGSLALSMAAVFLAPTAGFFLLPTRIWELLLGAALAMSGAAAPARQGAREGEAVLGAGLILFGFLNLQPGDPFPGWNALFPCLGALFVIHAGSCAPRDMPWVGKLLASRPFVAVGLISYSLYLVHWPLLALFRYRTLSAPTPGEAVLLLALTFLLAWASWRFVEQPFRQIGASQRGRVLVAGVATIAAGVAVGAIGPLTGGMPQRFPDFREQRIAGVEDWGGDRCFNQNPTRPTAWDARACTRIKGGGGRILLWGDSFAAQYVPGVLRDKERINADVLQYTFAGCPPVLAYHSYARVGCRDFNHAVLNLIRQERIDTVVLAARWTDTPRYALEQLGETIDAVAATGAKVVVFGQSPQFSTDVQHIDYLSGLSGDREQAAWSIAFDPALNRRIAAQAARATFVDPLSYLCQGTRCIYRDASTFLYADYGHFSAAGSLRAVKDYFPSGRTPQAGVAAAANVLDGVAER